MELKKLSYKIPIFKSIIIHVDNNTKIMNYLRRHLNETNILLHITKRHLK